MGIESLKVALYKYNKEVLEMEKKEKYGKKTNQLPLKWKVEKLIMTHLLSARMTKQEQIDVKAAFKGTVTGLRLTISKMAVVEAEEEKVKLGIELEKAKDKVIEAKKGIKAAEEASTQLEIVTAIEKELVKAKDKVIEAKKGKKAAEEASTQPKREIVTAIEIELVKAKADITTHKDVAELEEELVKAKDKVIEPKKGKKAAEEASTQPKREIVTAIEIELVKAKAVKKLEKELVKAKAELDMWEGNEYTTDGPNFAARWGIATLDPALERTLTIAIRTFDSIPKPLDIK